jgi:hypothetical protein
VCAEIHDALAESGRLFVSASGLGSELGEGYAEGGVEVGERFGPLAPALANKHEIHEPVCLYTPDDMRRLAAESGFAAADVWTSAFGNVKAAFR